MMGDPPLLQITKPRQLTLLREDITAALLKAWSDHPVSCSHTQVAPIGRFTDAVMGVLERYTLRQQAPSLRQFLFPRRAELLNELTTAQDRARDLERQLAERTEQVYQLTEQLDQAAARAEEDQRTIRRLLGTISEQEHLISALKGDLQTLQEGYTERALQTPPPPISPWAEAARQRERADKTAHLLAAAEARIAELEDQIRQLTTERETPDAA